MLAPVRPEEALIYVMVSTSAVDAAMSDAELLKIGDQVRRLPVFANYDENDITQTAQAASVILGGQNGLDDMLDLLNESLSPDLFDTAYALAVEVVSADFSIRKEELRFLQLLRDRFGLDKLTVAAIERSAIARYRRL